jgi:hypothetical protein
MGEILFAIALLAICGIAIFLWYALPYIIIIGVIVVIIALLVYNAVLNNYKQNVIRAELISQTPIIERQAENTGYSVGYGRYISSREYYRYKNVITGYKTKFDVVFKDGNSRIIECKEGGGVYRILVSKTIDHQSKVNNYLFELDIMSLSDFEESTNALVSKAKSSGYTLEGYTTSTLVKHYQTIENVGIGIIRDDYISSGVRDVMIVTNRYLTPKAKEFCKNGRILVIDRTELFNICMYLSRQGLELVQFVKK